MPAAPSRFRSIRIPWEPLANSIALFPDPDIPHSFLHQLGSEVQHAQFLSSWELRLPPTNSMLENLNDIAESLSSVSYGRGYQTGLVQQITDFLAELGFCERLTEKTPVIGFALMVELADTLL